MRYGKGRSDSRSCGSVISRVGGGFTPPLPVMSGVPALVCDMRIVIWRSWTRAASLYASGSAASP
jgi:hypothetical protein